MQKVILYPHGGSGNHGCEALVRSTAKICKGRDIILVSKNKGQDLQYGIGDICRIVDQQTPISILGRLASLIRYRLFNDSMAYEKETYRSMLKQVDSSTVCLSFGGDNYCYGKPVYIYRMNELLRSKGAKTILWGCSIEPSNIDDAMLEDLRGYHRIIARESITYKALTDHGLTNVTMAADPAFTLDCDTSTTLPEGFINGNTVGINLSPMAMDYSKDGIRVMNNYRRLINHILEDTDMNVALIPHVVWSDNDDRNPLLQLYNEFNHTKRICMIDDTDATKIKGVISQCRFIVAARTHASIAAYSTGIPTLVLGYSVKARGIAKDIFGEYEKYVLPVQNLENDADLMHAFQFIEDNESEIKSILQTTVAKLKESAMSMSDML